MDVRDVIIKKLKEFSELFTGTKFSYVFDKIYSQHVIEVLPNSIYCSADFAKKQIALEIELIQMFPEIEILFVTEGHDLNLPMFDCVFEQKELNYVDVFDLFTKDAISKLFAENYQNDNLSITDFTNHLSAIMEYQNVKFGDDFIKDGVLLKDIYPRQDSVSFANIAYDNLSDCEEYTYLSAA